MVRHQCGWRHWRQISGFLGPILRDRHVKTSFDVILKQDTLTQYVVDNRPIFYLQIFERSVRRDIWNITEFLNVCSVCSHSLSRQVANIASGALVVVSMLDLGGLVVMVVDVLVILEVVTGGAIKA